MLGCTLCSPHRPALNLLHARCQAHATEPACLAEGACVYATGSNGLAGGPVSYPGMDERRWGGDGTESTYSVTYPAAALCKVTAAAVENELGLVGPTALGPRPFDLCPLLSLTFP